MLLLIKSIYNILVLAISTAALVVLVGYVKSTYDLDIASSPKAMLNLKEILLPPLLNLQIFIFIFDAVVALYYIYNWPIWDGIKKRFVYYQFEATQVEKQDVSSLLLNTVFVILTKGLALAILITMQAFCKREMDKLHDRFQYKPEDKESVSSLSLQISNCGVGIALDSLLAVLLLVSIVINCATVGTPLQSKNKSRTERKYQEIVQEGERPDLSQSVESN